MAWFMDDVPRGMFVRKEEPLTLADSEPEPDVAVVAGAPDDYRADHPSTAAIVVEVAIASLGIDRAKADVYAAAGVPEYWIVIPETRSVEVYRSPSIARYEDRRIVTDPDGTLQPGAWPALPLTIERLFG